MCKQSEKGEKNKQQKKNCACQIHNISQTIQVYNLLAVATFLNVQSSFTIIGWFSQHLGELLLTITTKHTGTIKVFQHLSLFLIFFYFQFSLFSPSWTRKSSFLFQSRKDYHFIGNLSKLLSYQSTYRKKRPFRVCSRWPNLFISPLKSRGGKC